MKNGFRSWSDIRVFLAVARAGSTLAASRSLGMAQPTVARRIEALEHETGLTLFHRDTRGFRPTDAANHLIPQAEAIEAAADAFAKAVEAEATANARPIRITAASPNFSGRFTQIFAAFAKDYPHVRFEFVPSFHVLDLSAGEADIALRLTNDITDKSLICRKISTARFALFASRGYIEEHGKPSGLDDIAGHSFVTLVVTRGRLHNWLQDHVPDDQIVMRCLDVDAHVASMRTGLGIGLLNLRHAEDFDDLVQCGDTFPELDTDHWMLVSPEAYKRPEVKAFTAFFAPRYSAIFKAPKEG